MKGYSGFKMQNQKLISQGAEAKIILSNNKIIKNRIKKSYRISHLDEKLRKQRTKSEAKILEKTNNLINTPRLLAQNKFSIEIECLPGERLSETLNSKPEKSQIEIIKKIAQQTAIIHNNDIIHGDLTTSNTILYQPDKTASLKTASLNNKKQNISSKINWGITKEINAKHPGKAGCETLPKVYIIDFGLLFISKRIEDKAVDLHLIKQALEAKHYQNYEKLFNAFLSDYNPKDKEKILGQLKKVEARGRYKH